MNNTSINLKNGLNKFFITAIVVAILALFLMPFGFMLLTSFKTPEQISIIGAPIWPAKPASMEYNGTTLEMSTLPLANCDKRPAAKHLYRP